MCVHKANDTPMRNGWLAAAMLAAALHCYGLYDVRGVWQGIVLVNEDEWRFDVFDVKGQRTEWGQADTLVPVLKRLGLTEHGRPCPQISAPCFGRATRC